MRTNAATIRLVRISPPDYRPFHVFDELVEALDDGLTRAGFTVRHHVNELDAQDLNLVIGGHLLSDEVLDRLPDNVILYNFEQLAAGSTLVRPAYLNALARGRHWDYSQRNIDALRQAFPTCAMQRVPVAYSPVLTRLKPAPVQDIDVLFYGTVNERRQRVLQALADAGLRLQVGFSVFGTERDELIRRAKLIVNIHYYDTHVLETVRLSYLMANAKAIVSECAPDTEIDRHLADGLCLVPYEKIVDSCRILLALDDEREQLESRALQAVRRVTYAAVLAEELVRRKVKSACLELLWRDEECPQPATQPLAASAANPGDLDSIADLATCAKPHVLIIDPTMPLHDRASGGLRLFNIIKMMRLLGCEITYIARYGRDQHRYIEDLERLGVQVYATDSLKLAQLGISDNASAIEIEKILTERPCHLAWLSFYHVAEQYLFEIRHYSPRTTIAIDSVDVHFLRESRQAELLIQETERAKARHQTSLTRRRELAIYSRADTVVTVTDHDADVLRTSGMNRPIRVVPNIHFLTESTHARPLHDPDLRNGLIFVGNFNHSPNVDAVLWFCHDIMPIVLRTLPSVILKIVGTNPPSSVLALACDHVQVLGWVPQTEPYVRDAKVSIAPLRAGAGMKGKIGESLSHGTPVVTTSIGAEGMRLMHGKNALIEDDPMAFAEAIIRLHRNNSHWTSLSKNGREYIERHYDIANTRDILQNIICTAVEKFHASDQ